MVRRVCQFVMSFLDFKTTLDAVITDRVDVKLTSDDTRVIRTQRVEASKFLHR